MKLDFDFLYMEREGRLDRTTFWIASIILVCMYIIVNYVAGVFLSALLRVASQQAVQMIAFILRIGIPLAFFYPAYCLFLKRGFDRDRSAFIVQALLTALAILYLLPKLLAFGAPPETAKNVMQAIDTASPLIQLLVSAAAAYLFVDFGLKEGTKGANRFGPKPAV